ARYPDAAAVVRALQKCREQLEQGGESHAPGAVTMPPSEPFAATTIMPPNATTRPSQIGSKRRRIVSVAGLLMVLALGTVVGWRAGWFNRAGVTFGSSSKWESPVIAILPVVAIDGEEEEVKLADSLTNELINRVGQLPGVRVIPRGAVMAYK